VTSSILLAILLTSAPPTFEVRTADGQTLAGALVEFSAERLALSGVAGRTSLDVARLLSVVAQKSPRRAPQPFQAVVELIDGSIIEGEQFITRDNQAEISLSGEDVFKVPLSAVRSVQFQREADTLGTEWARLTGGKADADLLIVRVQDTLDRHKGVLHDVTESALRFDLGGEIVSVKRSKIYGFVYRHSAADEMPPAVCTITDAAGSKWVARSVSLTNRLQWTTCAGLNVSQPLESIAEIDFSGGKVAYLSDLRPISSVWTPYFATEKVLPEVARFYAPRFDRGFDSGTLTLGGKTYRKGLALACRTEIVYRLPDAFRRFDAVAGIDDAVRPGGRVRLIIRGDDDKVLFDATLSGSDPPRPVELDLTGVRRVKVVADFSGSFQSGSRLLLACARIMK
jgi:hypothetical protein